MTRRVGVLAVVLALGVGAVSAAGSGSATVSQCGPAQAQTLAASSVARIYASGGMAFGCSEHGAVSYALGAWRACLGSACVEAPEVSGDLAGYGLERCGVDTCSAQVAVRRLSDGMQLRMLPATTGPLGAESFQSVASLVLKSDGAVAWIGLGSSIGAHRRLVEVHRANAHGAPNRLDSGEVIKTGSLRLHGSKLTWRHGRHTFTATLS